MLKPIGHGLCQVLLPVTSVEDLSKYCKIQLRCKVDIPYTASEI